MVYVFLADGFEEIEALCPVDMMRRVGVNVKTVSIVKREEVTGSHGICVKTDLTVHNLPDAPPEMIVLPGGMPGAKNLRESAPVCYMIKDAAARGAFIAAICAAPFILGELGLLKGKAATCFPGFENKLTGAVLSGEKVVRDGNIITAAAMGASVVFGAEIIKALCGLEESERILKSILY